MVEKSMESDFFFSGFSGFDNFFKPSRQLHIDLKNEFKIAQKLSTGDDKKNNSVKPSKIYDIVSKVILNNYKNKMSPMAKKYIGEIESTGGVYSKRDKNIVSAVSDMYKLIKESYKSANTNDTIFDIYIKAYDILFDKKWSDAFSMAYNLKIKGSSASNIVFLEYVSLVYTVEAMAITLFKYVDLIESKQFDTVNNIYCSTYTSFVASTCKNIIKIIYKCEGIKDPKKYITESSKVEKTYNDDVSGKESEMFKKYSVKPEESVESLIGTALIVAGVTVLSIAAAIAAIRYIIYSISCLKVDISKSLIDQSYTILVNIETLESKLSTLKKGSTEYKKMEEIIEKQKNYTNLVIGIANKFEDNDIKNIDDIREKEYDDNNYIEDTYEEESEDSNSKGFNI